MIYPICVSLDLSILGRPKENSIRVAWLLSKNLCSLLITQKVNRVDQNHVNISRDSSKHCHIRYSTIMELKLCSSSTWAARELKPGGGPSAPSCHSLNWVQSPQIGGDMGLSSLHTAGSAGLVFQVSSCNLKIISLPPAVNFGSLDHKMRERIS
jgi:hypothetical protein